MNHLTDQDLNGYIHQTLTDAERETLDQHLAGCAECRTRLDSTRQMQRDIYYGLADVLRSQRPSTISFTDMKPGLNQWRRRATVRFHTLRLLANAGIAAVVLVVGVLVYTFFQTSNNPQVGSAAVTITPLFDFAWTDPAPYRSQLVGSQQGVLDLLTTGLPVYHLDLTVSSDLTTVNGRQQLHYTNQTGAPLSELVFRLLPNLSDSTLTLHRVVAGGVRVTPETIDAASVRLLLPQPLPAGEEMVVQMDFTLEVGRSRKTFGGTLSLADGVLAMSHFHPTIAPYTADGWLLAEPQQGMSTLNDNAFYLVRVDVPLNVDVVGTGAAIEQSVMDTVSGPRQTVVLAAGPVNHFALALGTRFTAVVSDRVGDTHIQVYANADYLLPSAQDALAEATAVVAQFNERFGSYPFTELDIVNAPNLSFGRNIYSYPGLIMLRLEQHQSGWRSLESATVSAVAYQWFGRTMGYEAVAAPWLAHGLTAYAALDYYARSGSPDLAQQIVAGWSELGAAAGTPAIGLPLPVFDTETYEPVMFGRSPLFLYTLADLPGLDATAFDGVLRQYYQRSLWAPADTAVFFTLVAERCGCDVTAVAETWLSQPAR